MAPRKLAVTGRPPLVTPHVVEEISLREIDSSDDTFRQRAIIAVDDLVAELRVTPQQVPVFLRRRPDGRYQIIAGFRRLRALSELGRPFAKAIVVACDDREAWRIAWAENVAHRKLRGVDLSYFVFKLHDEGHNGDEIAQLCGMVARVHARVAAVGRMPDAVRALVRTHGLTLRHGAVVATFVQRHPRVSIEPTIAAAARRGLGEEQLANELDALVRKRRGRPIAGVRFRGANHLVLDLARAEPEQWSPAIQKRMRTLITWLEGAVARAESAGREERGALARTKSAGREPA